MGKKLRVRDCHAAAVSEDNPEGLKRLCFVRLANLFNGHS